MIPAAPPVGAIQRGRGGFYRNDQGTPYISDPSGDQVQSGKRKGEIKRIPYGSPSSRGKLIEDTWALNKWGERKIAVGIGIDLALIADCALVAQMDQESQEFRDAADRLVLRAKEAAQAGLAAERGSHAHALSEDYDDERDWILRAEAGEILGLDLEVQTSLVDAWRDMLDREGLEILAVEASCVDDTWRLAGTLDRIARTTKSLRFALVTGEVVVIPSCTVLIVDIKSGKRTTRTDGSVQYWQGYAVQIASYAQSVPYDVADETRGAWPWEISQEHALIAHLDVLGALEGAPSCTLIYCDVAAGREHGGATVVAARDWGSRRDVFSVAQLDDDTASSSPAASVTAGPSPVVTGLSPQQQYDVLLLRSHPAEGEPADENAVKALEVAFRRLDPDGRRWVTARVTEAQQHQVSFHLAGMHTRRRFDIVRGLCTLATVDIDDETTRSIIASILGDAAWYPTITIGHLVGSFCALEATVFADRCGEFVFGTVPGHIDEVTERLVLAFAS
jgi:hypothetical protein